MSRSETPAADLEATRRDDPPGEAGSDDATPATHAVTAATKVEVPWPLNRGGELAAGTTLDRYVILRLLGRGGMGDVYQAYDPDLDREIAIKVLFLKNPDGPERRRAEREAQAMARLVHPNVVRIYDVGVVKQRLFLAMELVQGRTLRKWLSEARRRRREIVRVMVLAGRGIVAAHAAGLIHRDIKPSNILVGADGRVLVADFGLARFAAPGPDSTEESDGSLRDSHPSRPRPDLHEATTAAVVGTPAYMAPEQRRGETGELTDQFSFCITLYEALYGARPDPNRLGNDSWLRSRPPRRPSATTDKQQSASRRGERTPRWLRRILLRGLAIDPRERFPSMAELLGALDHDRREWWIRGGLLVVAAAGLGVALAQSAGSQPAPCTGVADGKLAGVWDSPVRATVEHSFAESGLPYAEQAYQGTAKRLDRWMESWRGQRTAICEATWVRHEQSEPLLDARMQCLDRQLDEARALVNVFAEDADRAVVEKSVAAVVSLPEPELCATADLRGAVEVADPRRRRGLDALRGQIDRMRALRLAGKFEAARAMARSVAIAVSAGDIEELRPMALYELGLLDADDAEAAPAEEHLRAAAQAAAAAGDDELAAHAAANLVFVMGYMLDQNSEALAVGELADAMVRRAGNPPELRAQLLTALGGVELNLGHYATARERFGEALRVEQDVLAPDDPKLAKLLNNYGLALYYASRSEEAIPYLERARDVWSESLGPNHPDVADALNNLGLALEETGRLREAQRMQERAIPIWEAAHGPDDQMVAGTLVNLGAVRLARGDVDGAQRSFDRALAIREKAFGPDNVRVAIVLGNLAEVATTRGNHAGALELFRRTFDIFAGAVGEGHPYTAEALVGVGSSLIELGRSRDALEPLGRALALAERPDVDAVLRAKIRFAMARAMWRTGKGRARAVELAKSALTDLEGNARHADERDEIVAWLASPAAR